jgi:hypothetical protein
MEMDHRSAKREKGKWHGSHRKAIRMPLQSKTGAKL